jgi:hypothetical protein
MSQVVTQSDSDAVRRHVSEKFINPAKQQGQKTVVVNVGEVHKTLGMHNRVPLVCLALKSKKFLEDQGLRILSVTGPPSGQSTTVTYTYEILGTGAGSFASPHPLIGLRGIAKEIFKKLGGGENFIRSERSKFDDRSENS